MKKAFTLSEVLIALVVIGIVAAITIPNIQLSIQNKHFKTAYKKAFSDLSRATLASVAFGEFPVRETKYHKATAEEEWNCIKKNLIATKICEKQNAFECWEDADKMYNGPGFNALAFIDNSGRTWVLYSSLENVYLVDTNGKKKPNKFGKDRWAFTLADETGKRICSEGTQIDEPVACSNPSLPKRIIPFVRRDFLTKETSRCNYPPCYYFSWLYK